MRQFAYPTRATVHLCLSLVLFVAVPASLAEHTPRPVPKALRQTLTFEQNRGQAKPEVEFLARAGRYRLYLTKNAAILNVLGDRSDGSAALLRANIVGANADAQVSGIEQRTATTNYLVGPKEEWKTGVAHFGKVRYHEVYSGIDLVYYGTTERLEYDFVVATHADPSTIALEIEGADKLSVDRDGSLSLETAAGKAVCVSQSPTRDRTAENKSQRVIG